jgi:serine/threonine protein kinase
LFELAEGDVRFFLDEVRHFDTAWRLRSLHHVATGLRQLHMRGIAHQDLKPSNVLVYAGGSESRVGDLGRACDQHVPAAHDELPLPGDRSYAPPEQLYGFMLPDWGARRLGCDTYLLGSLIVFFFCNVGMTPAVVSRLPTDALPKNWGDGFDGVLPFLRSATEDVIQEFDEDLRNEGVSCRSELVQIVRSLCDPDPRLRGMPTSRSQFDLERLVSRFDLLARREQLGRR